jgi:hypothetical protein
MKTPGALRAFTLTALFFHGALVFAAPSGVSLRRLEWEAADGVVQYEVRVETREENRWRQIIRQTVRGRLYIDCELKNGEYRFCVRSFDIIGRPGGLSAWLEFSVARAEPARTAMQTAQNEPPAPARDAADVSGKLPEESAQTAQNEPPAPAGDAADVSGKPPEESAPAQGSALSTVQPAASIQAQFDGSVDVSKPIWRVSAALAPFIALPVGTFNNFYTDTIFQPVGFLLSIESMPFHTKTAAFGIQLLPSWNFLTLERFDSLRSTHIVGLNAAFAVQIKILRASVLNIRAGGGGAFFFLRQTIAAQSGAEQSDTAEKTALNPSLIAGISVRTFFVNALFLDIGADYFHCVASDDVAVSFARPFLALGWWF